MSHFGLLVFTKTKPSEAALNRILKPYKEGRNGGKWDWFQIGGRWTGHLTPQYDPEKDPANKQFCTLCLGTGKRKDMEVENGCNGCQGKGTHVAWPTQWKQHAGDQMQVSDIPIAEIRAHAAQNAAARWDEFQRILAGRAYPDWDAIRERHGDNIEAARREYHGNPVVKDFSATAQFFMLQDDQIVGLCGPRADYITARENSALSTMAFVDLDGEWHERAEMGWFGMTRNEKEREVWSTMFANAFKALPPTAWVTVVDCHI